MIIGKKIRVIRYQNHELKINFKEMDDWKAEQPQHVYGLLNERKSGRLCL